MKTNRDNPTKETVFEIILKIIIGLAFGYFLTFVGVIFIVSKQNSLNKQTLISKTCRFHAVNER